MAPGSLPKPSGSTRQVVALALALLALGVLIVGKVIVAVSVGPAWDTYAFLADAAEFAGRGFGYSELHRPPFLAALTAVAFRLGAPMAEAVIQWVDGALALVAVASYCCLLRRRLGLVYAAVGSLALLIVPPVWSYIGVGYTDITAVGLSALLLLTLVKATEDQSRWFLLAGPLFVAAALTRHTALLVAMPALVWVLLRWRPFRQVRHLVGALALAALAYLPAARLYNERFGEVFFPYVIATGIADEFTTAVSDARASGESWYYVRHLPELLGPAGLGLITVLVIAVGVVGLAFALVAWLGRRRLALRSLSLVVLATAPAIAAQLSAGLVVRQLTLVAAVLGVWRVLAPRAAASLSGGARLTEVASRTKPAAAFDAMMLAWLLAYLDLHQHQAVQDARYFIPMAPAVIYFVLRGWSRLAPGAPGLGARAGVLPGARRLGAPSPVRNNAGRVAAAIPPATLAVLAAIMLGITVASTPHDERWEVTAAKDAAAWLQRNEPDLASRTVYSDLWPQVSWYLRAEVRPMPFFKDEEGFAHELERSAADYYITTKSRRFANYRVVSRSSGATVLARTAFEPAPLPRIVYLGQAWRNYLEQVTDYRFYLLGDDGKYGREGTAFLDALTAGELAQYDAVAVYDVRWRNRYAGEAALTEYAEHGGSVIIDASSNLGKPGSNLTDTVMFDTIIGRAAVPADARVEPGPGFKRDHPEVGGVTPTAFVAPGGGDWFGADYAALPGGEPLEVLAWLGDCPAVSVRRVGAGRVYFLAGNLVWHAFLTGNEGEARLVAAVLDDAVDHTRAQRARFRRLVDAGGLNPAP